MLCWLPSGSRDQNTSTNGLLRALNIGSTTLAGDVGQIGLLRDVGDGGARRLGVAGLAVVAARRRRQRKIGLGQRVLHLVGQRNAVLAAGGIVDRRMVVLPRSVWSNNSVGPSLPIAAVREALVARHLQDGFFVEIVAVEMLVDIAEHGVVLDEGDDGVAGGHRGIAGVDRVGERAGIAEIMAGRHRRAVGHGEGREQRMRILEVDALVADLGHRGRGLRRHDAPAQAVRDEQDQVAGRVVLRRRRTRGQRDQACGQQYDGAAHEYFPVRSDSGDAVAPV